MTSPWFFFLNFFFRLLVPENLNLGLVWFSFVVVVFFFNSALPFRVEESARELLPTSSTGLALRRFLLADYFCSCLFCFLGCRFVVSSTSTLVDETVAIFLGWAAHLHTDGRGIPGTKKKKSISRNSVALPGFFRKTNKQTNQQKIRRRLERTDGVATFPKNSA